MDAVILATGIILGILAITTVIVVMEEGVRSSFKHLKDMILIMLIPTIVLVTIVLINAYVGR